MANIKDGATGTVLTAPSPATSGTSLVLNSGEGARFPTAPFYVIAHPNNTIPTVSTSEKLLVTAISTDTLTITRAQGIYTAKSIAVGWRISNAIFQDDMNNASIVRNEVPGGTVNGSTTAFTLASAAGMATGSLEVYKNGVRMKPGGADFTQTTTGFTMVTAPATGTVLLCDYIVAGALNNVGTNSLITDETPAGLVNSSNATFTLARAYIATSVEVYINGLKQFRTTDFTETTPASGIITMLTAPTTGDVIRVNYQFNLNPAGNADTVDGFHSSSLLGQVKTQQFSASGTYTPDAKMLYCIIECVGAGGGGGSATGAASNSVCASGGGAGSYSRSVKTIATIGASQTVTIGAGGAGGTAGGVGAAGGDTSVGILVIGKGGSGGGGGGTATAPGVGGVVGTGDITVRGNDGGTGIFNGGSALFAITGGAGGSSYLGASPNQAMHTGNQAGKAGATGAGGSGGSTYNSAATNNGGAGGSGYIIITEFCQP